MRDLHNNIGAVTALSAQVITTSAVNGSIIDTLGFNGLEFVVTAGTITDGTVAATLTEGDAANLSDGAAVTNDGILGTLPTFAATDDNKTKRVGYSGSRRYVRLTLTPTGATSGGTYAAVAVLGHPASAPVA
ncbi:hypothetical protein FBZ89_104392 [Nitrospirillum amazonense]|uniref:Uncharacterized protein n=1 Tax=Nitrospirillum amazonense TaxID=28077 RepID=A0A560FKL3_9PROT|nr:hypothetical protein [Nitrospirillum amazonense]TWB22142.1 hypothetical protein FBZ89_104392 [Nitrospirillum amazonense]